MGSISAPRVEVVKVTRPEPDESGQCYIDLAGSSSTVPGPIVAGAWSVTDFDYPASNDSFEAEWDEVKYVTSGEAVWTDTANTTSHTVRKGDLIWLPKGSRSRLTNTRNFSTIYVEQTFRAVIPASTTKAPKPSLDTLFKQLKNDYISSNPKSKTAFDEACTYLPGGNTRSVLYYSPFPMTLDSGRNCFVTSLDGREYLDCVSDFTAGLFGHSHDVLKASAEEALSKGFSLGGHILEEAQLAKHLVQRFRSIDQVRFCNSGTEANMYAVAIAKCYSKKEKVLVFRNCYHGGTLTFTYSNHPINIPHDYVWGTYNDIEATKAAITATNQQDTIGTIIVEPM